MVRVVNTPLDVWVAGAVFVVAYLLIALERWDRTLIALLGGLLVVVLGIVDQEEAFAAIDLNVIFLLVGMMTIASILAKTGFFDWLAIRSVRLSRGEPLRLLVVLSIVTALLSAFLDNVTTVVLMTPIILSVTKRLDVPPMPYLISIILASNIGGTATLIGDPPNLLIGSAAGLGFDDFLVNLGPVVVLVFLAFLVIVRIAFTSHLQVPAEAKERAVEQGMGSTIHDRSLLARALIVTGATIVGFLVHSGLGVEPATIALLGATSLMLIARQDPHETLRDVEWSTIFFFVGLFVLVESVVAVGIIGSIAAWLVEVTAGNDAIATIALLWFSALASAIVDNIPYTATAIPVVQELARGGMAADPLWWALALGACLGGNLTIVGASANVVVANLARREGHEIRFTEFIRYGGVTVAASLLISTGYLWIRYLA